MSSPFPGMRRPNRVTAIAQDGDPRHMGSHAHTVAHCVNPTVKFDTNFRGYQ
jgi:hypothetical protein